MCCGYVTTKEAWREMNDSLVIKEQILNLVSSCITIYYLCHDYRLLITDYYRSKNSSKLCNGIGGSKT
jgi:hypothetical protein